MNTGNKIVTALLVCGAGLVASLTGWAEHWSAWPLPLAAAACVGLIIVARRQSSTLPSVSVPEPDIDAPHLTGPHRENPVDCVRLPSQAVDYDFLFSAIVRWRLTEAAQFWRDRANANPGAQAVNAVIERARTAAALEQPEFHHEAQNRLAAALGIALPDSTGRVEAWATNVSLRIPPDDLERVNKLADLRKEADLWARRREFERERRSYLGDDVFKSTGSAIVWMLAQTEHDEADVHRTVRLIGPLAQLSAAANDSPVSELYQHLIPSLESTERTAEAAPDDDYAAHADSRWAENGFRPEEHGEPLFDHLADVIRGFAANGRSERSAAFAGRLARVFETCELPQTARMFREAFGLREPPRPDGEDSAATNAPKAEYPAFAAGSEAPLDGDNARDSKWPEPGLDPTEDKPDSEETREDRYRDEDPDAGPDSWVNGE